MPFNIILRSPLPFQCTMLSHGFDVMNYHAFSITKTITLVRENSSSCRVSEDSVRRWFRKTHFTKLRFHLCHRRRIRWLQEKVEEFRENKMNRRPSLQEATTYPLDVQRNASREIHVSSFQKGVLKGLASQGCKLNI